MRAEEHPLGYLAYPDRPGASGIVLVHDVWGLHAHQRDLADRLAHDGFAVLAVNLYRREGAVHIPDPARWIRELSDPRALADVQEAVDALRGHAACRGQVGVIGFCMGGMVALLAGCTLRDVSAIVSFYGLLSHERGLLHDPGGLDRERKPRSPLDAARDLRVPLLGLFGGKDEYIAVDDVGELERRARATGQPVEVVVYPEAGHAFVNDTRPSFRPADAQDAWARMLAFLRRYVR